MFVGRARALALGDALVADLVAGRGRLVLLAGEAGIGKTALAREILDRAEAAGAVPHWGGCFEGAALLPYGVWMDCLRYPADSECTVAAARLEHGDTATTNVTDAGTAQRWRLRLFADVVADLRRAATHRPQALVLDDLHWADVGSLELLTAVGTALPAMPVLVVATYRDDELDPSGPLARIGGGAERLMLEGLAEDEVAALLAEVLGREPSGEEAKAVYQRTGGNPLFVSQAAWLAPQGSLGTIGVPVALRDVLARRLARLSASSDQVLGVASVLGAEFDAADLVTVAGRSRDDVLAALDEAGSARLVVRGDDPSHWRFVHELVRAARYETLGSDERRDLHRRVIEALAARSAPAGVLAHHAALAGFGADDLRPARFDLDAARESLRHMAWEEAVTLARRAVRAASASPEGDTIRADAWLALGDGLLRTGDHIGATDAFTAAADIGRATSSPELVGRAALGFGAGLTGFEVRLLDRRQVDLLEEAADALAADAPLRPLVLARLSVALSFLGSDERRRSLADEAVASARRADDERALAAALAARCDAMAGPDHITERLTAADEIIDVARRSGDLTLELLGRRLRVVALVEQRDLGGFRAEIARYSRAASELGDPFYSWYADLWRAMGAHADGRLAEAQRLAERAAADGRAAGSHNADLLCSVLLLFLHLDRGDTVSARERWRALLADEPLIAEFITTAIDGLLELADGRPDRARVVLEHFGAEGVDRFVKDQEWLANLAQVVLVAASVGDRAVAARAYELLSPYEGLGVFEGIVAMDHGPVDRFLALTAGCCGDVDAALRHTERAVEQVAGSGRLVEAHTRAGGARALVMTGDPDLRGRAAELAGDAARAYESLGLEALADAVRRVVDGPERGVPVAETETAELVRDGDTWAFTFAGTTVRVRHAKGVADLGALLSQRGRPVHVRTLEGVDGVLPSTAGDVVLDDEAIRQYRRRLDDLEEALDEADRHADRGRAERLAVERDALVEQLTAAFGLSGRRRLAPGDPDERLRKAVSARVKASIDRIDSLHPMLGRHLRHAVRTGYWCSYEPEQPVDWTVVTVPKP